MIVVFDGLCNACNGFVGFLSRRDRRASITFVPAQSDRGVALLEASGERPDDPSTMLLIDGGTTRSRSDAAIGAVAGLGGAWRAAALFRFVPRDLRDRCYDRFARNRYRWFGRAEACAACAAEPESAA